MHGLNELLAGSRPAFEHGYSRRACNLSRHRDPRSTRSESQWGSFVLGWARTRSSTGRPSSRDNLRSRRTTCGSASGFRPPCSPVANRVVERLDAVVDHEDVVREVALAKRPQRQVDVIRIIFDRAGAIVFAPAMAKWTRRRWAAQSGDPAVECGPSARKRNALDRPGRRPAPCRLRTV